MTVTVVSFKYSPGLISQLKAYNYMFSRMGCKTTLLLAEGYRPYFKDFINITYGNDYKESLKQTTDIVLLYNIAFDALKLAKECKNRGIEFCYVCHEPWGGILEAYKEGDKVLKYIVASIVNMAICYKSECVLLPSKNAVASYKKRMLWCNTNYKLFPLIFCDEYNSVPNQNRCYFSSIGTFVKAHGCKEFLSFVQYAADNTTDIKFMIASRNNIDAYITPRLQQLIGSGRLILHTGKPMTTQEINTYYRQSICVWNAYNRSTQSGVLPNAFMQGAPVIANKNGAAKDIFEDGTAGKFIEWPANNLEIMEKYRIIEKNIQKFSENARDIFLKNYEYSSQIDLAYTIFEIEKTVSERCKQQ
ncbi:MAG: glycosyltransferase family 1 protein [Ruthenibacterium sp.]